MLPHQSYSCGHYLIAGLPAPNELKKSCINLSISVSMGGGGWGKFPKQITRERETLRGSCIINYSYTYTHIEIWPALQSYNDLRSVSFGQAVSEY